MDAYRALAEELMLSLDRKHKAPPHEEISRTMRGEMAVLRLLVENGESMTAGEISRELRMKTSRIAAVLGSLEKKEMILRQADEADKRRVLVTLTQQGSACCHRRRQEVLAHMTAMLAYLGEDDAENFVRIMKRTHEFMHKKPPFEHEIKEEAQIEIKKEIKEEIKKEESADA